MSDGRLKLRRLAGKNERPREFIIGFQGSTHRPDRVPSKLKLTKTFRTGSTRDKACAALHDNLYAAGVAGFDRNDALKIHEMRPVDPQKTALPQLCFQICETNADEIFSGWRHNRHVIVSGLGTLNRRKRDRNDSVTVSNKDPG